jgi:ABC-type nitrate/sulfonate/bicarbonate transport system substrate-binding protein
VGKSRSYLIATLVLAALALILGFYLLPPHEDPKPAGPPEQVTIAYSATTDNAVLAEVAQVQGYYLQEGLQATAHLHPYGKLALQEVLEGKADFAVVAETPVMLAIMNGARISLVATVQTATRANAIVARKDRGILVPGDLKGRRIAVTSGTTADYFMDTFLALHEIARKDMTVIDLKPGQMAAALAGGEVDAVSVFMPFPILVQKKLGARAVAFYDENVYTSMFSVVATQKFLRENPGKVRKLLRALIRAEKFVGLHPEQAQRMIADLGPTDLALVREIWPNYRYAVKLEQSLVLALEDETLWAVKEGLVGKGKMPDYLEYIYLEGLESIKPKAVRILR